VIFRPFTLRNLKSLALLAVLGIAVFWVLSAPHPLTADALPSHVGDPKNGEVLYNAGGCHSCHLPAKELVGVDSNLPAGGTPLKTPIGTLYPPNITSDPETGIGTWSDIEFVNAMQKGLARDGQHLIPAFPYTSYTHMAVEDVLDIKAYLATIPAIKNAAKHHDVLALPLIRRGLGLWKWIGFDDVKNLTNPNETASWNRGKYLVNGPGHCNECHTPRTIFMTSDMSNYLSGGPHPEGVGKVPSLRGLASRGRYKDAKDLASAFEFGEAMGYDKIASGGMGAVQRNLAKLPAEDRLAIAEYITSLK
jgi:mono/diheme cytochrome c family protein